MQITSRVALLASGVIVSILLIAAMLPAGDRPLWLWSIVLGGAFSIITKKHQNRN